MNNESQKLHEQNLKLNEDLATIANSDVILEEISENKKFIQSEAKRLLKIEENLSNRESALKIKEESCKRLKEDLEKKKAEQDSFIEMKASEMAKVLVEEKTKEITESYLEKKNKLTKKVESKIFYKNLDMEVFLYSFFIFF